MIKLENVYKSYRSAGAPEQEVLKGINFRLKKDDSIAITGSSGCGKSTLLNLIGGLDRPSSGSVYFNGKAINEMDETEIVEHRLNKIGFIFQEHHLLPQCSVFENILIPTIPRKAQGRKNNPCGYAVQLLEESNLLDKKDSMPSLLSGGEKQRVAVIRALINRPELILADEPTGSLDKENALKIIQMLVAAAEKYSISLVVVTHSDEIASKMKLKYKLSDGRLSLAYSNSMST